MQQQVAMDDVNQARSGSGCLRSLTHRLQDLKILDFSLLIPHPNFQIVCLNVWYVRKQEAPQVPVTVVVAVPYLYMLQ